MTFVRKHCPSIEPSSRRMTLLGGKDYAPKYHKKLRGIAFWISSSNQTDPVRVVITLQAVASLFQLRDYDDLELAFSAFKKARDRIESAACAKYEKINDKVDLFEGITTFLLMTGDSI